MKEYLTKKQCKAGAYLRLSIEDEKGDSESISIINQRTIIMEYAKKIIFNYMITISMMDIQVRIMNDQDLKD